MRRLTGSFMGFASAAARRRAASASMVAIDPSLNSTETMTGRERVEAAIALGLGDRPPMSAWGHTFKEEWTPSELARVTVERARKFGWDFVKFQLRASCFAEAFGSVYHPSGHRLKAPVLEQVAVPDVESWQKLALVNPKALDDQVEAIGLVARELGPGVPVIQTVFSPLTVAGYLVGRSKSRVMRDLPAQAISWSVHNQGNPTLVEGRRMSGKAVMGGLGQRSTLLYGPPPEIEAEVRRVVGETGGRGLLVAPGCSVPPRAHEANLAAMAAAMAT